MNNLTNHKPDNYLVWAILSTLLCCMPFGIVAIVKATQVDTFWAQGNQAEAIEAANAAKKWTIVSAVSSVAVWSIYVLIVVIAAIACEL
ncbi:MAG: CD225/dispanin family protein [Alistipes sp.]|nr:CD225/dispanin family protein [Alistipes sp.]MBQ6987710.1 CD225/dispanin family protein [Alistipes sp.]